ncbi:hypothetical protein LB543_05080 [Mesorhizobium sp. ESP7-2]|uniref:Mom family adenine methylcarbamoylation protein n=1 Tax=Mesorhizobium sp. ESP7-2 TaxID=2876622 RepID=UPI001CCD7345|nr:hypothetical protein [Mesorhizobium sp. ESP7-2]MBZ9706092.1 hypothetical protein [Mesorhizobium sp. ESP7-2]
MADEPRLIKSEWLVKSVDIATARALVEAHHYAAGASNTATYLHGLFNAADPACCLGVAWWIPPTKSAAKASFLFDWTKVLALSRLVIAPDVPKNAATFLLARSRKLIDPLRWPCLVTYADQWRGHTGAIYKADNWQYVGLTQPERTYIVKGRMTSRKTASKTRTHAEMLALGAEMIGSFRKHKFIRVAGPTKNAFL